MSNQKKEITLKKQAFSLIDKSLKTIEQYNMFSAEDALLVGVSGGPDSVALLLLLLDIARSSFSSSPSYPSLRIGIAHINHCLRGEESERDQAFVTSLAEKYNLPCHTLKIDVPAVAKEKKLSFEEAARDVRYAFYSQIAKSHNYTKIALGHNSDDNAELVLMNLLRGSGTKGIAGISPVRDNHIMINKNLVDDKSHSDIKTNKIIRPLIEVSRQEILEYLNLKQQTYVLDSSNDDTTYLRNRIRHSLIPHLKESYNPSVVDSLNRLSRIIMDEESWMEEETEHIFRNAVVYMEEFETQLDLKFFNGVHPALAKRLARRAIESVKGDLKRITLKHIDDILALISSVSGGTNLHLPDRIRVIKSRGSICFRKESRPLRELKLPIRELKLPITGKKDLF
ncbi:MAG: tRNA lysidine(34) synthetase TilS [Desulfamplus sp.]|nr:tRNA lysidine(34) synthetase TilS [Desulfamplus sp.]